MSRLSDADSFLLRAAGCIFAFLGVANASFDTRSFKVRSKGVDASERAGVAEPEPTSVGVVGVRKSISSKDSSAAVSASSIAVYDMFR